MEVSNFGGSQYSYWSLVFTANGKILINAPSLSLKHKNSPKHSISKESKFEEKNNNCSDSPTKLEEKNVIDKNSPEKSIISCINSTSSIPSSSSSSFFFNISNINPFRIHTVCLLIHNLTNEKSITTRILDTSAVSYLRNDLQFIILSNHPNIEEIKLKCMHLYYSMECLYAEKFLPVCVSDLEASQNYTVHTALLEKKEPDSTQPYLSSFQGYITRVLRGNNHTHYIEELMISYSGVSLLLVEKANAEILFRVDTTPTKFSLSEFIKMQLVNLDNQSCTTLPYNTNFAITIKPMRTFGSSRVLAMVHLDSQRCLQQAMISINRVFEKLFPSIITPHNLLYKLLEAKPPPLPKPPSLPPSAEIQTKKEKKVHVVDQEFAPIERTDNNIKQKGRAIKSKTQSLKTRKIKLVTQKEVENFVEMKIINKVMKRKSRIKSECRN